MRIFFTLSVFLFILFCQITAPAAIYEISAMSELVEKLADANEQDWVVFDVDDVIIVAKDQALRPPMVDYAVELAMKHMAQASVEERKQFQEIISLVYLLPERNLIEPHFPEIFKELQARGLYLLAETHCDTGKLGLIPKIETWRINHLKSLDVDFSRDLPPFALEKIKKEGKKAPVYDSGILFCKGYPKGEVLSHFIALQTTPPRKVYFVDDLVENVLSVQECLDQAGIACDSFIYTGAKKFETSCDPDIVHYQFHHLLKHRTWLTDEEVQALLRLP